jgi:hypothetical protein
MDAAAQEAIGAQEQDRRGGREDWSRPRLSWLGTEETALNCIGLNDGPCAPGSTIC